MCYQQQDHLTWGTASPPISLMLMKDVLLLRANVICCATLQVNRFEYVCWQPAHGSHIGKGGYDNLTVG